MKRGAHPTRWGLALSAARLAWFVVTHPRFVAAVRRAHRARVDAGETP